MASSSINTPNTTDTNDTAILNVPGARDKGTSGKFYNFQDNTRRVGTLDITQTAVDDAVAFQSERLRRERAYQWHARWAMPNYDQMKTNVRQAGAGLDSKLMSHRRIIVVLYCCTVALCCCLLLVAVCCLLVVDD